MGKSIRNLKRRDVLGMMVTHPATVASVLPTLRPNSLSIRENSGIPSNERAASSAASVGSFVNNTLKSKNAFGRTHEFGDILKKIIESHNSGESC